MTGTGPSPSGVSGIDAQLSEFKRLDAREDGSAVLTLVGKSAERFYFRLPADQLAPLAAAIDLHLGRRPAPALPLDAEQIVRFAAAVLTPVLDAGRHPDARQVDSAKLTLAIGEAVGIPLPFSGERWEGRLLPYGATAPAAPAPASDRTGPGGADASSDLYLDGQRADEEALVASRAAVGLAAITVTKAVDDGDRTRGVECTASLAGEQAAELRDWLAAHLDAPSGKVAR